MRQAWIAALLLVSVACRSTPQVGTGSTSDNPSGGTAASASGLEAAATFSGTVTDRTTGKGVEGATVALKPNDSERSGLTSVAVRSTADGAFVISTIVPGRYAVDISARGYSATQATIYFSPAQDRRGYRYQVAPVKSCPAPVAGKKMPGCP